jgi:putative oxidoreductase
MLAVFTAFATLFFHNQFTDPVQGAMAMKNLAIIGGLLLVIAHSQMWWSYDAIRRARRDDRVATKATHDSESRVRDAEARAHEAELRVARLEGAISATDGPVAEDVVTTRSGWS